MTNLLGVHDSAFADIKVSHGNQGVVWWAEGIGELILAKRLAGKVGLVFFHLSFNLKYGKGGEGISKSLYVGER